MVIKLKKSMGVWEAGSQHFPREYVSSDGIVSLSYGMQIEVDHSKVFAYLLQDGTQVPRDQAEVLVP